MTVEKSGGATVVFGPTDARRAFPNSRGETWEVIEPTLGLDAVKVTVWPVGRVCGGHLQVGPLFGKDKVAAAEFASRGMHCEGNFGGKDRGFGVGGTLRHDLLAVRAQALGEHTVVVGGEVAYGAINYDGEKGTTVDGVAATESLGIRRDHLRTGASCGMVFRSAVKGGVDTYRLDAVAGRDHLTKSDYVGGRFGCGEGITAVFAQVTKDISGPSKGSVCTAVGVMLNIEGLIGNARTYYAE